MDVGCQSYQALFSMDIYLYVWGPLILYTKSMRRAIATFVILLLLGTILVPALAALAPVERLCCVRMAHHCGASAMGGMSHDGMKGPVSSDFVDSKNDCRCCSPIGRLSPASIHRPVSTALPLVLHPHSSKLYFAAPPAPQFRSAADRAPPFRLR